jgi:hypothetical protein
VGGNLLRNSDTRAGPPDSRVANASLPGRIQLILENDEGWRECCAKSAGNNGCGTPSLSIEFGNPEPVVFAGTFPSCIQLVVETGERRAIGTHGAGDGLLRCPSRSVENGKPNFLIIVRTPPGNNQFLATLDTHHGGRRTSARGRRSGNNAELGPHGSIETGIPHCLVCPLSPGNSKYIAPKRG